MIKNENVVRKYSHHSVPCGKCHECRLSRGAGWAFRLLQEEKRHSSSFFVTYTYSDSKLCFAGDYPTLVKSDLQLYFKRLRKRTGDKLKYYACGEYGTRTHRPHYHAILFGSKNQDAICECWPAGSVKVGPVTAASISYTCGYVNKPSHKFDDGRLPEFSLMSKGLGSAYLTPEMIAYHKASMASFVTLDGGIKKPMPRYYRDKIFDQREKELLATQAEVKHELELLEYELRGTYYESQHNKREAVKAAIRKQEYNLRTKRNTL